MSILGAAHPAVNVGSAYQKLLNANTAKATFAILHDLGFWPVMTRGKRPIDNAWGSERWTLERCKKAIERYPEAGAGICLGPERGPDGSDLMDLEGDGEGAEASLLSLLGGEMIETLGWKSARGSHALFTIDPVKMAEILPRLKKSEGKGSEAGVYKFAELPGLELRIGGRKPDGSVKQLQSVVPPTIGDDGQRRCWNEPGSMIAPAPEAFYALLRRLASSRTETTADGGRRSHIRPSRAIAASPGGLPISNYGLVALQEETDRVASAPEGTRHDTLRSASMNMAGLVNASVLDVRVYREKLHEAATSCGLPYAEADELIESALRVATPRDTTKARAWRQDEGGTLDTQISAVPIVGEADRIDRTDLGNARRLVRRHGHRIRFHVAWQAWLIYDGRRWAEDRTGEIERLAKETVGAIFTESAQAGGSDKIPLAKWAIDSQSLARLSSMIALAKSEPGIPITPDRLDCDPMLLNVRNGTIDLRTGGLRPHNADDLITKLAPVDFYPDAKCPIFDGFLAKIFGSQPETIGFVQRAMGYALTGETGEQCLFFFHGGGANGKSTLLNTGEKMMGDYAITIDPKVLMSKEFEDHSTELCDLDGPRFVNTVEMDDGKRMAEGLVKRLTGGSDTIRARRMRRDPYQFSPKFKIFVAANCKPEIRGTDHGIWRRIHLVHFDYTITEEEKDKDFDKKLMAEASGILAWLVRGCSEWQSIGLDPPQAVRDATAEYRREMDSIQIFLDQRCDVDLSADHRRVKYSILRHAYEAWCGENGIPRPMSTRRLSGELRAKGFVKHESNGHTYYCGLTLKERKGDFENDA